MNIDPSDDLENEAERLLREEIAIIRTEAAQKRKHANEIRDTAASTEASAASLMEHADELERILDNDHDGSWKREFMRDLQIPELPIEIQEQIKAQTEQSRILSHAVVSELDTLAIPCELFEVLLPLVTQAHVDAASGRQQEACQLVMIIRERVRLHNRWRRQLR